MYLGEKYPMDRYFQFLFKKGVNIYIYSQNIYPVQNLIDGPQCRYSCLDCEKKNKSYYMPNMPKSDYL